MFELRAQTDIYISLALLCTSESNDPCGEIDKLAEIHEMNCDERLVSFLIVQ